MAVWATSAGGQSPADNTIPVPVRNVKIGVLANQGAGPCQTRWGAMADYLTARIPHTQFQIVTLGYNNVEPAVAQRRIDFVLVNSAVYVMLEAEYQIGRIATVKSLRDNHVATVFGGVVFCRANRRDIRSLNDLKGKSFMAAEENSFGGWLMVLRELRQKNITPSHDFTSLRFAGTHDEVVAAVLRGDMDAGAVRTGTLEHLASEGKIQLSDFRIMSAYDGVRDPEFPYLVSTRTYPEWPMAKLQATPLELSDQVVRQLRAMPSAAAAARDAQIAGWTYPGNYNDVRECLTELGIGPFRPSAAAVLVALVSTQWPWFLLGALAVVTVVTAVELAVRLNHRLAAAEKQARDGLVDRTFSENMLRRSREELRLARDKAEETATRLRKLSRAVEQNPASIVIVNRDALIEYVNPGFVKTTGYSVEEVVGKNPAHSSIRRSRPAVLPTDVGLPIAQGSVARRTVQSQKERRSLLGRRHDRAHYGRAGRGQPLCGRQNRHHRSQAERIEPEGNQRPTPENHRLSARPVE